MKRVVIRTSTQDRMDGTSATESERIEESSDSGLLEAWGFLALFLCTFLLFMATYRVVSGIVSRQPQEHLTETDNYGIQRRQTEPKRSHHPL